MTGSKGEALLPGGFPPRVSMLILALAFDSVQLILMVIAARFHLIAAISVVLAVAGASAPAQYALRLRNMLTPTTDLWVSKL